MGGSRCHRFYKLWIPISSRGLGPDQRNGEVFVIGIREAFSSFLALRIWLETTKMCGRSAHFSEIHYFTPSSFKLGQWRFCVPKRGKSNARKVFVSGHHWIANHLSDCITHDLPRVDPDMPNVVKHSFKGL